MKITRDVIYDLLPAYFSGDISPDTRALVDEFLEQDPEFRRMMERFRTMFGEPRSGSTAGPGSIPGEKVTFERARSELRKRSELHGYRVAFGIAGIAVLFVAIPRLMFVPAVTIIALLFLVVAVYSQYQLAQLKRREPDVRS